jgi:hypothetical protein
MFLVYNANGREIASYDSQPAKFAARELLLRGTTSLNYVVGRTPELLDRSGFQLARDGRYRSAYAPVSSVLAAAFAWPLWKLGIVDVRAPRAPGLMAKFTSSLLVSLAVGVIYLTARRRLSRRRALLVAAAFGLGTGFWNTASQTLWQHETTILGLTLAVFGMTRPASPSAVLIGIGLGVAAASRLQVFPILAVVIAAMPWLAGWRAAAIVAALALLITLPILIVNWIWFGTVLGAAPLLEALHPTVHLMRRSFRLQWEGTPGLLLSPNRGLLIYSPIIAFAAAAVPRLRRDEWRRPILVCLVAAFAQFQLYAHYTVWWGGHTYGPRYMLDVLPMLVPLAVVAADGFNGVVARRTAILALAWSITVAAIGAFCYPRGAWNSDPVDVDRAHDRLWHWSDNQIARVWNAGASPQNFSLFTRDAVRASEP